MFLKVWEGMGGLGDGPAKSRDWKSLALQILTNLQILNLGVEIKNLNGILFL